MLLPTPSSSTAASNMLHHTSNKPDLILKSSCGDLQSRLKVRKVLGVGDASGSTASSKISQILGQSDHLIFQLPPNLATWLIVTTALFSCFTLMGFLWPSCLRLILPGGLESTVHLATSYAFLTAILALTLRSGDKTSLQSVLCSLVFFHALSLFIALWLLKTSETRIKSTLATILHCSCLLINAHFYRTVSTTSLRYHKLKTYLNSLTSFSSSATTDHTAGHDSSLHTN